MSVPFIVIDGQDGSGKGTQIRMLKERLEKAGVQVIFTREPGGVPVAEEIREVFLSALRNDAPVLTQFLLMWAARSVWHRELVVPSILQGVPVISDRGDASTLAYQVAAQNAPELWDLFWEIRAFVYGRYYPSAYIFIDVPAEVARARAFADAGHTSTFDLKPLDFYEKVRGGFHEFTCIMDISSFVIDGTRSREEIHEEVYGIIAEQMGWA